MEQYKYSSHEWDHKEQWLGVDTVEWLKLMRIIQSQYTAQRDNRSFPLEMADPDVVERKSGGFVASGTSIRSIDNGHQLLYTTPFAVTNTSVEYISLFQKAR